MSAQSFSEENHIFTEFKTAMDDPEIGTQFQEQRKSFHAFLLQWMHLIAMVIGCFTLDPITLGVVGVVGNVLTATTYNDYYKLSMAPTIHYLQQIREGIAIATFALDIRDPLLREIFSKNVNGITDAVIQALNALKDRKFDYQVILNTVAGKPFEAFFHSPEGRAIFINADGSPRNLISEIVPADAPVYPNTVIYNCPLNPDMLTSGQVAIAVFMAPDAKTGETRIHIEATGEWSKVSFLETTMMQVVYQVALRNHLQERCCSFGQWLYEALFRFYLSVTYSGTECPGMTGFLFAGRRTGHFLLLLLQALLAKKIPGSKIVGTSSFDAWAFLTKRLSLDPATILSPVGTHAHEIQMGAQSLFAWLDMSAVNSENLILSACVSTYIYYLTAHQGKPGPMPMLPDTLGSESFCKAASCFMVHPMKDGHLDTTIYVTLLSLINSARQDSGDLGEFATTMKRYEFTGGLFASEIDEMNKLREARDTGYTFFGAGGVMGDSEKPWDVTGMKAFTASMAVKIVRMWLLRTTSRERCRNPVKTGDGKDLAKVTADSLLPLEMYQEVIAHAEEVKRMAKEKPVSSHLFYCKILGNQITVMRDDGVQL